MKNIVIFGSGGHAKVILSEILKLNTKYKFFGFVDNSKKIGSTIVKIKKKKFKIINLEKIKSKNVYGIIGIGDNYLRYKEFKKISGVFKKIKWESIISKNSLVDKNTKIGKGSIILSNTFISTGTQIKDHCIINSSNSIDHDNIFNNFSSSGPGVITGGTVHVDKFSHLGIGCVVKNNISIKENVICGGKSYINKNCKKNSIYFGIPSKFKKFRRLGEKYL